MNQIEAEERLEEIKVILSDFHMGGSYFQYTDREIAILEIERDELQEMLDESQDRQG